MKNNLHSFNRFQKVTNKIYLLLLLSFGALHYAHAQINAPETVREQIGGNLQIVEVVPLGFTNNSIPTLSVLAPNPSSVYSNITTFAGSALSNGGSEVQTGNTITRC